MLKANYNILELIQRHNLFFIVIVIAVGVFYIPLGYVIVGCVAIGTLFLSLLQISSLLTPVKINPDIKTAQSQRQPFVSIHVACHNEPPRIVKKTLHSLAVLEYENFEVLVVDNNTIDEKLWKPIEAYSQELGEKFKFFHLENLRGFKAGALNFALQNMDSRTEIIVVIDADYVVAPHFLREDIAQFNNPILALIQYPQNYSNVSKGNIGIAMEYQSFFSTLFEQANRLQAVISTGTLSLLRAKPFLHDLRWNQWCITEDAEVGIQLYNLGYTAIFQNKNIGEGLMPLDYYSLNRQRQRWVFGNMQILLKDAYSILINPRLTKTQKWSIFAQLTAWIHPSFVPMVFVVFALPTLIFSPNPSLVSLTVIAEIVLFYFILIKVIFFVVSLKRSNTLSLKTLFETIYVHFGLTWSMSTAWLKALLRRNLGYNRTNKDPEEETPELIPNELWWAAIIMIISAGAISFSSESVVDMLSMGLMILALFFVISTFSLKKQLRITKRLTKEMQQSVL